MSARLDGNCAQKPFQNPLEPLETKAVDVIARGLGVLGSKVLLEIKTLTPCPRPSSQVTRIRLSNSASCMGF